MNPIEPFLLAALAPHERGGGLARRDSVQGAQHAARARVRPHGRPQVPRPLQRAHALPRRDGGLVSSGGVSGDSHLFVSSLIKVNQSCVTVASILSPLSSFTSPQVSVTCVDQSHLC